MIMNNFFFFLMLTIIGRLSKIRIRIKKLYKKYFEIESDLMWASMSLNLIFYFIKKFKVCFKMHLWMNNEYTKKKITKNQELQSYIVFNDT